MKNAFATRILAIAATACVAGDVQAAGPYAVLDLGSLGGQTSGIASFTNASQALNASGQVAGYSNLIPNGIQGGFRTAPNVSINPATDNVGTLGGPGHDAGVLAQ